jgi:hypothetical protein
MPSPKGWLRAVTTQTIVLVDGSCKGALMKHQRLEPERFQAFADITRIMAAIATFRLPMRISVLKRRAPNEATFARNCREAWYAPSPESSSASPGSRQARAPRARHATSLIDFSVSGPNCVYAKAECNDENSRSNHVSKVGKD